MLSIRRTFRIFNTLVLYTVHYINSFSFFEKPPQISKFYPHITSTEANSQWPDICCFKALDFTKKEKLKPVLFI